MSKRKWPPGPIVEVDWIDSMGHNGWQQEATANVALDDESLLHHTAGYLWENSKKHVVIVQSYGETVHNVNDIIQIPKPAVKAVRRVGK